MGQRLVVFLLVGGVAGFGSVFLQLPGIVGALVVAAVLGGTMRSRDDLVRLGGYLLGAGLVGFSLVGPSISGRGGGFLFLSAWSLVAGYATVAIAGAVLVALQAISGLRRGRSGR